MDEEFVPGLRCTAGCGALGLIVTIEIRGVDHEHHPQQGTTQVIVRVLSCPVCGAGVYWCFDHDCTGYPTSASYPIEADWMLPMAADDLERLREGLSGCPDTVSGRCRCPAHLSLVASRQSLRHPMSEPPTVAGATTLVDGLPQLRRS